MTPSDRMAGLLRLMAGNRHQALGEKLVNGTHVLDGLWEDPAQDRDRAERRRPKVCVVGSGWQFTSGISYYTCRLTTALSQDFSTSALLMRRLVPRSLYPGRDRVGVPVNELSYPPDVPVFDGLDWYWIPSVVKAVRFLRAERPEVIVLQWWTGAVLHSYLAIAAVARSIGATLVIEFHEIQDTGEAKFRGASGYLQRLGNRLVRKADGYVVHSDFDLKRVRSTFPVDSKPVRIVPHGPFDHHTGERPLPDPATPRRTRILFFGTIRPYKGLETLVEAFDALPEDIAATMELMVVGETWEGWTLPLEMMERSPRRSQMTLVNRYVHDEEVAGFFAAADVVALPYKRSSASGPLHIAMSYGLPVVLTEVGGLREGAEGYQGISWAPPADVQGLSDALIAASGRVGERFADPRSWSHTVEVYDDLFADLRP
ncbi:MAG: hypothetical protein QOK10_3441 [Pseudonocardiales bacterium]|nr:hypothetical protein [Pseudonocardiales bacterium]